MCTVVCEVVKTRGRFYTLGMEPGTFRAFLNIFFIQKKNVSQQNLGTQNCWQREYRRVGLIKTKI